MQPVPIKQQQAVLPRPHQVRDRLLRPGAPSGISASPAGIWVAAQGLVRDQRRRLQRAARGVVSG